MKLFAPHLNPSLQTVINIRTDILEAFLTKSLFSDAILSKLGKGKAYFEKDLLKLVMAVYKRSDGGFNLNVLERAKLVFLDSDVAGIKYIEEEKQFAFPKKELSEEMLKRISIKTAYYDLWETGDILLGLLDNPSLKRKTIKSGVEIEDGTIARIDTTGVFNGFLSPKFYLDYDLIYQILDKEKVRKALFFEKFYWHQHFLHCFIQFYLEEYVFEVGKLNSSSYVYPWTVASSQNSPLQFQHVRKNLYQFLDILFNDKIKPALNSYMIELFGIKILYFMLSDFEPVRRAEEPLDLWDTDVRRGKSLQQKEELRRNIFSRMNQERNMLEYKRSFQFKKASFSGVSICFETDKSIEKAIPEKIKEIMRDKRISKSDWRRIFLLLKYWLEKEIALEISATQEIAEQKFIKDQECDPRPLILHWLHGFLIFDSWRKGRKIVNYLNDFRKYVSLLSLIGERTGAWKIEKAPGEKAKQGFWILNNHACSSNSGIAGLAFGYAISQSENLSEKRAGLNEACNNYPDYLDARFYLVNTWKEQSFRNVGVKEIENMLDYFESKENVYFDAYELIEKKRAEGKFKMKREAHKQGIKQAIDLVQREILGNLEKIRKSMAILRSELKKKQGISPDRAEYDCIKALIRKIRKKGGSQEYNRLIQYPAVKEVMDRAKEKLKKISPRDISDFEIISEIHLAFNLMLKERKINLAELRTLEDFKDASIRILCSDVRQAIL